MIDGVEMRGNAYKTKIDWAIELVIKYDGYEYLLNIWELKDELRSFLRLRFTLDIQFDEDGG